VIPPDTTPAVGSGGNPAAERLHERFDFNAALAAERRVVVERYREALIWCSGADDFAPDGKAREGWEKIVKPLLDAEASDIPPNEESDGSAFDE
jgi:hypothetical protein